MADAPAGLSFGLDFAVLQAQLGPIMGESIESEHSLPDTCDTVQLTTTGLAYLICETGEVGFAAGPDGLHHWALEDGLLLEWIGPELNPPATASPATLPGCGDEALTYCRIADGMLATGYLRDAGATNGYQVMLTGASTRLVASLTDLPADYDLYLVDGTGGIVVQSVQEGTTSEIIDQALPTGTYMLYVHVDPARAFDAETPYHLTLSLGAPNQVEAPPSENDPAVGYLVTP